MFPNMDFAIDFNKAAFGHGISKGKDERFD
jgi:hypothetical protein